MEFWTIVGDGNTRKTATVRALTGAGRLEIDWSVRIGSDPLQGRKTIVHVKSPQEGIAKAKLLPAQLVAQVMKLHAETGVDSLILPLRHDAINSYPDAATYIDHFITIAGWSCCGIAITATREPSPLPGIYSGLAFDTSVPGVTLAANAIASQLRARWNFN